MELKSMLFYQAFRILAGPLLSFHFRLNSYGEYNVPEKGAAIIIGNHRSYIDPFVLAYAFPRFINFGAGSHLYVFHGLEKVFQLAGFFPVDIYGGEKGDMSLEEASRLLQQGEVVGIFPEGIESFMNISRASRISMFKTGFVRLALENQVPIIPAAIAPFEEKEFPRIPGKFITPFVRHPRAKEGITFVTYRKVKVRIGIPVDLSPYYEETMSKYLMDHIAGKIRRIVIKLYDGEDLDRFMTGETPFDFATEMV